MFLFSNICLICLFIIFRQAYSVGPVWVGSFWGLCSFCVAVSFGRGLDCIDGCRFALVFPIVVAHFARFSTNNLTALKLLTQDGQGCDGCVGVGGVFWTQHVG